MKEITLKVTRFLICSTGEAIEVAEPEDDLQAAITLRDKLQENDDDETWDIVAEIDY